MSKKLFIGLIIGSLLFLTGCYDNFNFTNISTMGALAKIMTPRFIAHGASPVDITSTLRSMETRAVTDNWVVVWSNLAAQYEKQGQKNLDDNNIEDAKYQLLKASVYYRIAAYPYPIDAPREQATKKSITLFKQAIKFVNKPPKIITLTTETKKITGYFRLPTTSQKVPLVILLPGIDSSKEEMFWVEDHFLDKGFATFSIDSPGTGESDWKIYNDSDRLLLKVIDYFKGDSSILPDKIALVGFNFGGYWALKAITKPEANVKCVAIVSTPVHYTFIPTHLSQMPRFMGQIFMKACGVNDYQSMMNTLGSFSLKDADLLRDIKQPLLVIGSEEDILIPPEDILIFARELKRPTSIKLCKEGKFGIINNLQTEIYPMIANWLEVEFEK